MRRWFALAFLGLSALGQTLLLPETARVGEALFLEGKDLPQGRFPLEVQGPQGTATWEVEAQEGGFRLPFTPEAPGEYRVRLSLPSGALEGRFTALAPVQPRLVEGGLELPWGRLPLPEGPWLGPLVEGDRVFVAQGFWWWRRA